MGFTPTSPAFTHEKYTVHIQNKDCYMLFFAFLFLMLISNIDPTAVCVIITKTTIIIIAKSRNYFLHFIYFFKKTLILFIYFNYKLKQIDNILYKIPDT